MAVHQKNTNLYLVDLDQDIEGFRQFISCWIYQKDGKTILVDPGPASTIPVLQKALKDLNINSIDFILLTHIHIDHAGGTGALLADFPSARIICHPSGIPHMVDPQKLWQGSLQVLGKVAESYKPIVPVPPDRISYHPVIEDPLLIEVIETPGHAVHHLNFLIDGYLFAGEVAGVNVPVHNNFYLRIATPPRFIYEVYKNSLFRASYLPCHSICFGHYDMYSDVDRVFKAAKKQLELWIETAHHYFKKDQTDPSRIFEELLASDSLLASYTTFDEDIQQREKYFALNSIKGMLDYWQRSKNTARTQ